MANQTNFDEFLNWVQTFQQERKAPIYQPKKYKSTLTSQEEEVQRLRGVLYAREEGSFGATENGYLAGISEPAPFRSDEIMGKPAKVGNFQNFLTQELGSRKNDVQSIIDCEKICSNCEAAHRVCLYPNLQHCEKCGYKLKDETREIANEFTCYIYGIETFANKKLTMAVRYEDEHHIVTDEQEGSCMFHTNVILADTFIPDWRTLLMNPVEGLKIVKEMFERGYQTLLKSWNDDRWRNLMHPQQKDSLTDSDIREHLIAGFSIPPSCRNQIHLIMMCPPFLPKHYQQLILNNLFTYRRWFPIEYVMKILTLSIRRNIRLNAEDINMPIDSLIAFFDDIPYDAIHSKLLQKYARSHNLLTHFPITNFRYIIADDKIVPTKSSVFDTNEENSDESKLPMDRNLLWEHDRTVLTSDGAIERFYSYAKPYPLPTWSKIQLEKDTQKEKGK